MKSGDIESAPSAPLVTSSSDAFHAEKKPSMTIASDIEATVIASNVPPVWACTMVLVDWTIPSMS